MILSKFVINSLKLNSIAHSTILQTGAHIPFQTAAYYPFDTLFLNF